MSSSNALPPLFDEFPPISDEEWTAKIEADLDTTTPNEVLRWDSIDGISLPAYLRRDDREAIPHVPTEGTTSPLVSTETVPSNNWRIRQDLWHSDLETAGALGEKALRNGVTDLGLIIDPNAGALGLPLDTPGDVATLLQDLPLDASALHFERGSGALALLSAGRSLTDESILDGNRRGTVSYDPVAALATGALSDIESAFDLTDALLSSLSSSSLRAISLDLRPYHDAGASAVQELAFGLGALTETLARLHERTRSLDDVLPHLHVQTSVSTSYFIEIAKLRALRLLVPQVLEAFADETGSRIETSPADLFVQAETSRRTETLYDPYVNMLRGTTEAMAAVVGGCDVLNVRPYNACFDAPTTFSSRIARNVQLILGHEAHFDVVADPAAGAYYVEQATDRLAERAWERFQTLEADGGILPALRQGELQSDIAQVRQNRQQDVANRDRVLVGTNHFPDLEETRLDDVQSGTFSCNNGTAKQSPLPSPSLDRLQECIENGWTIPELANGLAAGSASIQPLPRPRLAEPIEALRLRTERYAKDEGSPPTVLLAPLGPTGPRSARATFARNVLGVAGFEIIEPLMFDSVDAAADEAADTNADIVVLCSANEAYADLTPALRRALEKRTRSPLLVVAGNPQNLESDLPADEFIHSGRPLYDTLTTFQQRLGIPLDDDAPDA